MNLDNKIKSAKELQIICNKKRKQKKKIILCHGVFDLIHIGHILHLKEAKSLGDVLVVTITDQAKIFKGPGRPYFNNLERAKSLAALGFVDYVSISEHETGVQSIKIVKPVFYCKGQDYSNNNSDITGNILLEKKELKKNKGKIYITRQKQKSSSKILNNSSDILDEKNKKFLSKIKKRVNDKSLEILFKTFQNKKILIIGETIIDEYVFCEALGKSGKDPILVTRELNKEKYLGGVSSVARCLSSYSKKVNLLTTIGEKKENLNFIKKNLPKNINTNFFYKKNSPTIIKKRYIDHINKNKVFGSYLLNDEFIDRSNEKKIILYLDKNLKKFDLVIVLDYGHGMISPKIAKKICQKSTFLCLNAQVNASNVSYHSLSNYKKSNCVVINETELRRELRDREGPIKKLMKKLAIKIKSNLVIVTRGSNGSILFRKNKNVFHECPAFAKNILDKVGSGDNFLSTCALSLSSKADIELSMLIGSLSAASNVENFANKYFLDKTSMLKSIIHVLK